MEQIGPYNLYNGIYGALVNINTILSRIQDADVDEGVKTKIGGQMHFMRALYYFDLVQFFGDVIIITEPLEDPDQAWNYERSPISEVYKLIDQDIAEAVASLPFPDELAADEIGLPTKHYKVELIWHVRCMLRLFRLLKK